MPSSDPAAALTLLVGDEELLIRRAVARVVTAVRGTSADADVREMSVSALTAGDLMDLLSPSLFGEQRVVVLTDLQDSGKDTAGHLMHYAADPLPEVALVLVHAGGAKGKALLEGLRPAAGVVVPCAKVTRPADRQAFIVAEVRATGRSMTADAVEALLEAVGTDLAEIATACSQLLADTDGTVDVDVVARYHRGRAEASGFVVADRAVTGDAAGSLESLRWALAVGVAPVLVTSALAANIRAIARVAGARGNAFVLAKSLAMPAWKVERAQGWARGWEPAAVAAAQQAVAAADEQVKGGGADPAYALERMLLTVTAARNAS